MKYCEFDRVAYFGWFISFVIVLFFHGVLIFGLTNKPDTEATFDLSAAVMLSYSEYTESVMRLHDLPIGPPQVISQDSVANQPDLDPSAEVSEDIELTESPVPVEAELVVTKKKKEKNKKPRQDVRPKIETPRFDSLRPVSDVDSKATAASVAAPPPGDGETIASSHDSYSRNTGQQANWQARVLAHLARNQGYPSQALSQRLEGRVMTRITIDANGRVHSVTINRSSGHRSLDAYAIDLVKKKSPLPKPPEAVIGQYNTLTLNIPIDFNIQRYRDAQQKR